MKALVERVVAQTTAALVLAALGAAAACSGEGDLRGLDPGHGAVGSDGGGVGPCTDGVTQPCSVTLSQQGNVLSCYEGQKLCVDGRWSDCTDGQVVQKLWVEAHQSTASLGPASPCTNNPCDPACQSFNETPDGGIETTEAGVSQFSWQSGSLSGLPPGLVNKGLKEPCGDGSDCQFNTYCSQPVTDSSCAHSKCQTGQYLDASCDPCVATICAADPTCCNAGPPYCGHDACEMGRALDASCSSCTVAVCAARPSCCTDVWDAACVSIARTVPACGCPQRYACNAPGEIVGPNGHCYFYSSSDRTWLSARNRCRARTPAGSWDLVTVNNAAEQSWIEARNTETIWLGFNDRSTEGTFAWSSGLASSYTHWNAGQPNNSGNQDCAELCGGDNDCGYLGTWNDDSCARDNAVLCEYSAPSGLGGYCSGPGQVLGPNGHCYFFQSVDDDWLAARADCTSLGAGWDLATIDDAAENTWIDNNLPSSEDYWIGYNDRSSEGTFVWSSGQTSAYTNWDSGQPNNSGNQDCVELDNSGGDWNDSGCSGNNAYVCEHTPPPPPPPPNNWTQACVDRVATDCDAQCDTVSTPPNEAGQCVAWAPGQTDTTCSGFDLAVGVPCDASPTSIPVCNHGTVAAPAGIEVAHFAANSNQYPQCAPDLSHPSTRTCTTTAPIPPGECIDVTGCLELAGNGMGNIGNREIVVNPAGASHTPGECSCLDNWSLYANGLTCAPPSCSGSSSAATFKPVNMYIVLDRSGSMSGSRWNGAVAALTAFFQDSGSAGINVALEFFGGSSTDPGAGCACTGSSCSSSQCSNHRCDNPYVPLGALTADSAPTDSHESALINAVNAASPNTWTPTYPAMEGALSWATGLANPNEIYAVILVTDGNPTTCLQGSTAATNNAIAALAGNAYGNFDVQTYTVGMTGANITALNNIASQGGTGNSFVIGNGTASQVAADLLVALQAIAGQAVDCSFNLPNPGTFDPNAANVTYTGNGTTTILNDVGNSAGCGSGWYYLPNAANPTSIELCPSTCALVQSDPSASIDVNLACLGGGSLVSQTFNYEYQASCGPGQFPQWTFFTWDSTTPGDSSIDFRVRAADTSTGLAAEAFVSSGTSQASPDTQVCTKSGPAPACPVDLYAALGAVPAKREFLELEVTIHPTSDGASSPSLSSWQVEHTCVDSE